MQLMFTYMICATESVTDKSNTNKTTFVNVSIVFPQKNDKIVQ